MEKVTAIDWLFDKLWDTPKDKFEWHAILNQAKVMENQQMINFAEFVATYPDKNININGEMLHAKSKYDGAERTVDLLVTFKSE